MKIYVLLFLLCAGLLGCGPKTVGEDTPKAETTGLSSGSDPASALRYPLSGRSIDQRLYLLNQPQNMEEMQRYQRELFERRATRNTSPNDYNNLQPRQISPFRQ